MRIEIFKTGKHTDSAGNTEEWTTENLEQIASIYNNRMVNNYSEEAPLVKGHPVTDSPAFGWIERIARRGQVLVAKVKELNPEIINEVRQGLFKKVSIALYPDLMLRHVGLLGAASPAVKGLQPVKFNESISFKEIQLDNSIIDINEANNNEIEFAELNCKINDLENQNQLLSKQNKLYQDKICLIEKEARLKEFRAFANSLIENPEGSIITPAQCKDLIDIMEMAYDADLSLQSRNEFSKDTSILNSIKNFVGSLNYVFDLKEFAEKRTTINKKPDNFSDKKCNPERLYLHEKAKEIQQNTLGLSYEEAVCQAQKEIISNF